MIEEQPKEAKHLSPGVVGLIALLAIGGLLFIGWQSASITGDVASPYFSCCTVQPWTSYASGYRQGYTSTNSELCDPLEMPNRCCVRAGRERFNGPVNLYHASYGQCSPDIAYPSPAILKACCTVKSYQRTPSGYTQGEAQTFSQDCEPSETIDTCCARGGAYRLNLPVRVIGTKQGSCFAPEVSYPLGQFDVRGYSSCCSYETWRQSPSGYSQGDVKTMTANCGEMETQSQCCMRAATLSSAYPVKLLGSRVGSCQPSVPEANYPVWIR